MAVIDQDFINKNIKKLPPFSRGVSELLQLLDEGKTEMGVIAEKLLLDSVLAGRVLQMANSSFYGFSREISTVKEACVILGNHTIRNLIYTLAVMGQFSNSKEASEELVDHDRLWRHSLMVACLAMRLAKSTGRSETAAFTAGLFHVLGIMILNHFFKQKFADCIKWSIDNGKTLIESEVRSFETDHFKVSAQGLDFWNFPQEIVDVLADQVSGSELNNKLSDLLRICSLLACALGYEQIESVPLDKIDAKILSNSGLDLDCLTDELVESESLYETLSKQLLS